MVKRNKKLKKFYFIAGFSVIFFGTFIFWVESLNNYDISSLDLPAIKAKLKEEIASIGLNKKVATTSMLSDVVNEEKGTAILLSVPFTTQAPDGHWEDQRFQDGCEEASVFMAMKWVKGEDISKGEAKATILDMSEWELQSYGVFADTNAQDTADRLIRDYFSYNKYKVSNDVTADNIITQLRAGNLVLVPANGQRLYNPHYKAPGPEQHMLVVRGYNPATDEFITNDPGTRVGEGYHYKSKILIGAVVDYPTGDHLPTVSDKKAMIIVSK